ncbi:MAG: Type 1 glutamine amidotransferase-like domain-containing protein, partial [Candidatus Saccharimonadales bacterium]
NLVLIGGGTYAGTARPLLELGLDMSGKQDPHVLIVPTPKSQEAAFNSLVAKMPAMYADAGIHTVSFLHEFGEMPDLAVIQEKIDAADVLYISGGNTRYAMEQWRSAGVDIALTEAMRRGKVMTGISAGALTWFKEGHSDSLSYEVPKGEPWDFSIIDGIGQIDTLATPHFDSTSTPDGRLRSEHFKETLRERSATSNRTEFGLGIDNNAALVATNGLMRVVKSTPTAGLHVASTTPEMLTTTSSLDAPVFSVNSQRTRSMDSISNQGISWQDFYQQLGRNQ